MLNKLGFLCKYFSAPVSKIISSTPSKNHQPQLQHPHPIQQQLQQPTAAAIVAAATAALVTGNHTTNNINTSGVPTLAAAVAAVAAAAHNPAVQQHAPAPTLQGNLTITTVSASSTNSSNATQQLQAQSVIQATPTIAFSAVAKHNTCKFSVIHTRMFLCSHYLKYVY